MNECIVDECKNSSYKKGYCSTHYQRLRRNGTLTRVRKSGRDKCIISTCENLQAAHGLCNKHYSRKMKTGDPEKVLTTITGEPHHFLRNIVFNYIGDECLDWPYSKHPRGYGHLWNSEKNRHDGVHRLVCRHFHGEPPSKNSHAAHSCGNPKCCNWKHIRWATPSENNQDKKMHGTWQGGEANGNSKLTEKQVREIKHLKGYGLSQRKIAVRFGVSQKLIWAIFNGKTWSHVI